MMTQEFHAATLTGRVVATPSLSRERPDRPTRTTFWLAGRHSGKRIKVHAVEEVASAVCDSLRRGDVVTVSGVVRDRCFRERVYRILELDSFRVHPRDAA